MNNSQLANIEQRKQALTHWVGQQFKINPSLAAVNMASVKLDSLGSDAGFRRYYRLAPESFAVPSLANPLPLLAVDAPPETEDSELFVLMARYLRAHGIGAPAIIATDLSKGFLLVEDFGDRLLQNELNADTVNGLYGEALMTLLRLQQCADIPELLPHYDQAMLRRELEIFSEWFVGKLLGYSLSDAERAMLGQVFSALETSALEQPQVLVHRDYHSRNLMLKETGSIGVIDFQGAVVGPLCYDLASLLRDCYIAWPADEVKRWALSYGNMAMEVGILPQVNEADYLGWFDWIGLQRHLKVLGIFARLHLRDAKSHYLADLPLVIRYTLEVANHYAEFKPFVQWFEQQLLPLIKQQAWYIPGSDLGEKYR